MLDNLDLHAGRGHAEIDMGGSISIEWYVGILNSDKVGSNCT